MRAWTILWITMILVIALMFTMFITFEDKDKTYIKEYQEYSTLSENLCHSKGMEFVSPRKSSSLKWETLCATISPYKIYTFEVQE